MHAARAELASAHHCPRALLGHLRKPTDRLPAVERGLEHVPDIEGEGLQFKKNKGLRREAMVKRALSDLESFSLSGALGETSRSYAEEAPLRYDALSLATYY